MFLAELDTRGWTLRSIWLTHAHIDHILGVGAVKRATGAPIHLHPLDRPIYDALPQFGGVGRDAGRAGAAAGRRADGRGAGADRRLRVRGPLHPGTLARQRELRGARHGVRRRRAVQRLRRADRPARRRPGHADGHDPVAVPLAARIPPWCTAATGPTPRSASSASPIRFSRGRIRLGDDAGGRAGERARRASRRDRRARRMIGRASDCSVRPLLGPLARPPALPSLRLRRPPARLGLQESLPELRHGLPARGLL